MIDTTDLQKLPGCFPAYVQGPDILIVGHVVSAFGGVEDVRDGDDDGKTESGEPTAIEVNGVWQDTNVLGCALPIRSIEPATANSPLAFTGPHIPWKTPVKFWPGDIEPARADLVNTFPLLDNGPDTSTHHVADLTKAAAALFAPAMNRALLTRDFLMTLNVRVIGGARWVS
jgi:hypothetical protein